MRTSRDQLRYCRMASCTAASEVNLRKMRKYSSQAASWRVMPSEKRCMISCGVIVACRQAQRAGLWLCVCNTWCYARWCYVGATHMWPKWR
eukprot:157626-Prymnesium_polylepis.1